MNSQLLQNVRRDGGVADSKATLRLIFDGPLPARKDATDRLDQGRP